MQIKMQFLRYAVIGLISNALLYALYLLITWFGIWPKIAMSVLYILGIFQTFVFNKSWSFRYSGSAGPALFRYVVLYVIGYIVNFMSLILFVDQLKYPHQVVMAGLVIFMALLFFAGQKYWVFRQVSGSSLKA